MASNLRRGRVVLRPLETLTSPVTAGTQVRRLHEDYREPAKARLVRSFVYCIGLGKCKHALGEVVTNAASG